MFNTIRRGLQSSFPNVETIFLTIPICYANGERTLSVLKRVKKYLRNSLSQSHLTSLSMVFI